jgi:organic hydroperoxide reductase OsmC/OhrA
LFAAGYAACFGGALDYVATQKKKNAKGATVTRSVTIGLRARELTLRSFATPTRKKGNFASARPHDPVA